MNSNLSTCSRLMNGLFMLFMANGVFRDQQKTLDGLHSVVAYMERTYSLTKSEKDEVLYLFWKEYSKGCSSPMPESYIRESLIPMVYQRGFANISLGGEFVAVIKNKLKM